MDPSNIPTDWIGKSAGILDGACVKVPSDLRKAFIADIKCLHCIL